MNISISEIEARSHAALVAHGAGDWQAREVARAVARAEATGNVICGLYYLESYCTQLVSGRVNGTVDPEVVRVRPGAVTVNGRLGFAQPAFACGLPDAVVAARECGIARGRGHPQRGRTRPGRTRACAVPDCSQHGHPPPSQGSRLLPHL